MKNCLDCAKFDTCPKSRHIENYRSSMRCSEFIDKEEDLEVEEVVEE